MAAQTNEVGISPEEYSIYRSALKKSPDSLTDEERRITKKIIQDRYRRCYQKRKEKVREYYLANIEQKRAYQREYIKRIKAMMPVNNTAPS